MSEAARPRLVFATCRPPYPLDNGARIRAHRLLTGLAQSFDTLVVTFEFEPGDPDGHCTREQLQTLIPGAVVVTVPEARRAKRMGQLVSLPRRESWSLGRYRTAAYTAALEHAVTSHRPGIVHFDDAGVVVDLDDGEIASVGLHRRAHEIEELVELYTAPFALGLAYRPA